jgi:predicted phosphodiesterase
MLGCALYILLFVLVLMLGPPIVFLLTHFEIVPPDNRLWTFRTATFISAEAFFWLLVPLLMMGTLYAGLWRWRHPFSQFSALLIGRLAALYATIPIAVYSGITIQGALNFVAFSYAEFFGPHGDAFWSMVFLRAIEIALGCLVVFAGSVFLVIAVIQALQRGTALTYKLFSYYFPRELMQRSSRWPQDGYSVEMGDLHRVDILLVSDLHVSDAGATMQSKGNADSLGTFHEMIGRTHPHMVIVTGDLTDVGAKTQWERVQESLPGAYELVVVPGNHDYHFRHLAEQSMLGTFGVAASFASDKIYAQIKNISSAYSTFPLLYKSEQLDADVLALDSNLRPSNWPLTNGIGTVGSLQIHAAKSLLSGRNQSRALIIALHHHVIPPPFTLKAPFLLCLDHDAVVELALEHNAASIVHGHTHQPFVYKHRSGLLVISCGSLCFDAAGPFAEIVRTPSAYGIQLDGGIVTAVKLLRPMI